MTEAIVGAMAALAGAALGFGAAWYAAKADRKLELEKWLRARDDEVHQDTRLAVADLVTRLSEMAHSIMWFTFSALGSIDAGRPSDDLESLLSSFKEESHSLIAQTVGTQYRLAALHVGMYDEVTPLVSSAIRLSGDAIRAADEGMDAERLGRCNHAALELIKSLPNQLGGLIGAGTDSALRP